MSAANGLLIITCLSKIAASLAIASKRVVNNLYIHYHPDIKDPIKYEGISKALSSIYACSIEVCGNIDVRVIISTLKDRNNMFHCRKDIGVLMLNELVLNEALTEDESADKLVQRLKKTLLNFDVIQPKGYSSKIIDDVIYKDVVLGGTFDRIHIGHKILLSEAALRAKERIVVGVTDAKMLKAKKLPELVQPLPMRLSNVRRFLGEIDDTIILDVMEIEDSYGPTRTDPKLDLIVVSPETLKGGQKVNELRRLNKLKELDVYVIPLMEIKEIIEEKESKVSSSNQRMDILGSKFKEPHPRPNLPKTPYIIGLIGGIASGKSKMTERFQKMGAGTIDCDKLAHQLYEPGEKCYDQIVNAFGPDVINVEKRIDRKVLGQAVFSDKEKLKQLNSIIWPHLLVKAKERINELYVVNKCEIIILEAAVLLQANWESECHEIWSMIIPPEVAIERLMERNNLTQIEAQARIDSQMDNSIVVANSNVIFSSLWSYKYSQVQAEKAWCELLSRLKP